MDDHFIVTLLVIPLQMLSCYVFMAKAKGLEADKPRTSARSVTVE